MGLNRPGTKIPFWNPGFRNRPEIEPPGFLRVIAALSIFSVVGTIVYSVFVTTTSLGVSEVDSEKAIYVAVLHFLLPISVSISISTNSHLSRFLISAYVLMLGIATIMGRGFLGELLSADGPRGALSIGVMTAVLAWLFTSSKARYYYSLIAGKDLPDDLIGRDDELAGKNWLSAKAKSSITWVADHLETVVIFGFIAVVIYAFVTTS